MHLSHKNKINLEVDYTKELAEDLYAIHGIEITKLISSIYGTYFKIDKDKELTPCGCFKFTLITNDNRDQPRIFYKHMINKSGDTLILN